MPSTDQISDYTFRIFGGKYEIVTIQTIKPGRWNEALQWKWTDPFEYGGIIQRYFGVVNGMFGTSWGDGKDVMIPIDLEYALIAAREKGVPWMTDFSFVGYFPEDGVTEERYLSGDDDME